MGLAHQDFYDKGRRVDIICTKPTGDNEKMIAYGALRGHKVGSEYYFSPAIIGRTFIKTDTTSTTTTAMSYTFKRSDFANPSKPSLTEIVAALNTAWDETTDTDAVAGSNGELVVSGAATTATGSLTIGAGTANELLGFPKEGYKVDSDGGIDFVFDSEFGNEYLYPGSPRVNCWLVTVATDVQTQVAPVVGYAATWTPSSRTLNVIDGSVNAAGVIHVILHF